MPRKPRELKLNYCYHVTTRCNNREFRLTRHECRQVFIYTLKKAITKFQFKLYALCIMSNHVHYLIEPAQPEADNPEITVVAEKFVMANCYKPQVATQQFK